MTQKERLKLLDRGPGVFSYDGSAEDTEDTPAVYRTVIGKDGRPVLQNGQPVRELVSKAKFERIKIKVYKYAGIEFEKGEEVFVGNSAVALKMRSLPFMHEIDADLEAVAAKQGKTVKLMGSKRKSGGQKAAKGAAPTV